MRSTSLVLVLKPVQTESTYFCLLEDGQSIWNLVLIGEGHHLMWAEADPLCRREAQEPWERRSHTEWLTINVLEMETFISWGIYQTVSLPPLTSASTLLFHITKDIRFAQVAFMNPNCAAEGPTEVHWSAETHDVPPGFIIGPVYSLFM